MSPTTVGLAEVNGTFVPVSQRDKLYDSELWSMWRSKSLDVQSILYMISVRSFPKSIREAVRNRRVREFESSKHDLAVAVASKNSRNMPLDALLHNTDTHDAIFCVSA